MSELALALTIHKDYDASPDKFQEAIDLSERILGNCVDDKIRSTTKANLCFLYFKIGKNEAAIQLAKTLPHVWESREVLVPEIINSKLGNELFKDGLKTMLNVIYIKLNNLEKDNVAETSKMLFLGPKQFEDINLEEKIKSLSEFLVCSEQKNTQ